MREHNAVRKCQLELLKTQLGLKAIRSQMKRAEYHLVSTKPSEVAAGLFLTGKPQEVNCASNIHKLLVIAATKAVPKCLNAYC